MTASKFAGMLGNDGAAKAYRKKRLMIDHCHHVHASIIFVDSYLRIAQNVHQLCCLPLISLVSRQPATTFRKDTAVAATGFVFVIAGTFFVAGAKSPLKSVRLVLFMPLSFIAV